MSAPTDERRTGLATDRHLLITAGVLAYLVAAVHLFHPSRGFGRLVVMLSVDPGLLAADPRPLAFVLSGLAILVAVPAVAQGFSERPVVVAGVALTVAYLVGYFAWHLSGHGGILPGREPLYHGLTPVQAVVDHLTTDPWAAVAVVAELVLLAVLVVLLSRRG